MKTRSKYIHVAALVGFISAGSAIAAEPPKEGSYDFTSCWTGVGTTITFSKTHAATSYELTGASLSNPPGGMFDKQAFHCVGMNTSLDGKNTANTVCEAVQPDGGKLLNYFTRGSDGKETRQTIAGTGKYEGIIVTPTVQPLGPFPVVKAGTWQDCNHQTGTYKLK